jgi:hypothetical protein
MVEIAEKREAASFEAKGEMTDAMRNVTEDAALIAATEARLAKIEADPAELEEAGVEPAENNKPVTKPIVKPLEDPAPDETEEKKAEVETEEIPAELPINFHRAALASGWTDQDIQEFAKADPARAYRTFQNLYVSQTGISAQFAALGRKASEQPAAAPAAKPVVEEDDLAEITKQYGDDPLLGAMNALITKKLSKLSQTSPTPNPVQSTPAAESPEEKAVAAVGQIIGNFFDGDLVAKHYGEFYGSGREPDDRTRVQQSRRDEVIMIADQIMAGAKAQGQNPSIPQVLERAHWMVSAPAAKAAARKEIKETAVAREKGISLRPSKAVAPIVPAGNLPPADLEKKVGSKLASVFGQG